MSSPKVFITSHNSKNGFYGECELKSCLQYKKLKERCIIFTYQNRIIELIEGGAAGPSPILWAWRQSELNLADYLIDHHKRYLNHRDERGLSPLSYATKKGDKQLVQRLLASGASLESKAASDTLSLPHSLTDDQIGFLTDNYHSLTACNKKGVFPLLPAFQDKDCPMRELPNLEVNPESAAEPRSTPLSHAVRTRQMTVIEALLTNQSPPITALDLKDALDEAKGHQSLTPILKGYLSRAQIDS
ncbi:hypothetical protein E8E15_000903 [Penicillium rubens]|jgi:hypothetical protein|nr:hypothetical protein E8E15_000903 [Penicillium rubens]